MSLAFDPPLEEINCKEKEVFAASVSVAVRI